jgi:hypothetical protein
MWPPEFHTPYERDKHWRGLGVEGTELAAHIAAHDPARVLREIEAKRWFLEVLTGAESGIPRGVAWSMLRRMTEPYRDRPGWRAHWPGSG